MLNIVMKYKTLLVTGCSYTENTGSWAYSLASKYNLELINLAVPGVGNRHILFSLLSYLTKNNVDPETTLIGIMWSHPMRRHQIIEFNPSYADASIYKYKYDQYNRAVTNIDFYDKLDMSHPLTREEVYKNTVVLSNYNRSAHTLETWTYVESTVSYLLTNKFKFFQTVFLDYLNGNMTLQKKRLNAVFYSTPNRRVFSNIGFIFVKNLVLGLFTKNSLALHNMKC
jgi:hypothetical protein